MFSVHVKYTIHWRDQIGGVTTHENLWVVGGTIKLAAVRHRVVRCRVVMTNFLLMFLTKMVYNCS